MQPFQIVGPWMPMDSRASDENHVRTHAAFGRLPGSPPFVHAPDGMPTPPTHPSGSWPGSQAPSRGTVMECLSCGYVFVLAARRPACRRCQDQNVLKWQGGRQ